MHLFFVTTKLSLQLIALLPPMLGITTNYFQTCHSAHGAGKSLVVIIEHTRQPNGQLANGQLANGQLANGQLARAKQARMFAHADAFQVCRIDASTNSGARIAASYGATKFPFAVVTNSEGEIVYRGTELLQPQLSAQPAADNRPEAAIETSELVASAAKPDAQQLDEQPLFDSYELVDALQAARESRRMLVAFVTTRSCYYCVKMKQESLSDPEVQSTAAQCFTTAKIDGDTCPDFIERHGIRMFPTVLILTSQGALVDRIEGYVTGDQLASRLRQASSSFISQR
jgi:thioredoxin-related protein